MTRTQSLNLDAIGYLEVRTVPKEESEPFAEPEVVKEEAPNVGHRQAALTDAMRAAHLVAVPGKPDAAAAVPNASALPAVPFQQRRREASQAGAVPPESHLETLQLEAHLPHLAQAAAGCWDHRRSHLVEQRPTRCDFWAWMDFRLDALVPRERRR
jgi:hypothetical protein